MSPRVSTSPLRRAATSIALNIAEGEYSDPGNKRARHHAAAGSAGETRSELQVATRWQSVSETQVEQSLELPDRILRMLWSLSR